MNTDRPTLLLKAVVAALHATADTPSRLDRKLVERIAQRCLGDKLTVAQVAEVLERPLRVDRLARLVADQATAAQVYAISVAVVDQADYRARVYLDDLAEWLGLDAGAYRRIRAQAAKPSLSIAA